ncbi:MAG: Fe-S cluster assembly protein SufD [Rhizobiaceae bacterium]|jgi:Fe-S cluster assembly protein SufD|nr:Fe-S cluster assembly protein SufD [Rhizobiaceae bacterium]
MNMHVPRIHTAGEKALIAAIEAARATLPGNGDVMQRRDEAAGLLRAAGLPSRKVEAWHYTDLRNLLRGIPVGAGAGAGAGASEALIDGALMLRAGDDGVGRLDDVADMPEGVAVASMASAFASGAAAPLLAVASDHDAVGMVSAAMASTGFEVLVAAGAQVARPIQLDFAASAALHAVNRINIGAGAKAMLIERAHGGGMSSLVTWLSVADGADVTFVLLQDAADDALHFGRLVIEIGAQAKVLLLAVNSGGGLVRREIDVAVNGEHSDFKLRGMNLLSGRRHVDVTMVVRHRVEHTTSTELLRNVVTGEGRGVFQGQIRVAAEAQKTDARMACNTLLLSDEGEFLAKPELEIFADDVACGHGATVAEINRDHLFYLMARGVPEAEAKALLVRAFVSELLDDLEDEALHDALNDVLSSWLATH